MRQVARGKDMRNGNAHGSSNPAVFGQMRFHKRTVLARQAREWMECFDHTSALRPATARARRERNNRHLTGGERFPPDALKLGRQGTSGIIHIARLDIADVGCWRQPVLHQPDPSRPHIGADLLMLHPVKPIFVQQSVQLARPSAFAANLRQQLIEQRWNHARQLRVSAGCRPKAIQLNAA